jgi:UDP-N-acetylmuramyl pentapeptide phosphotransferase/UDP-N-acetylglucosamine-1-phosphate transferase
MYDIILSFLTAFTVTYVVIPPVIRIALAKNLCDVPGIRSSHTVNTPRLGGIAIFAGLLFAIIFWTPFKEFGNLQYILCAFIVIFLIGAKDDMEGLSPYKKLVGELLAAFILVFKSNVKLTSLYGIFGIYDIPDWFAIPFTVFTIIVIINAFNLIDGINGLSGSICMMIALTLGIWFYFTGNTVLAIIAFALAGSMMGFLKYNFTPAKIFMGDTGTLLAGLVSAILTIKFIELHKNLENHPFAFKSAPALAVSVLIFPLFDTLRVFVLRALKNQSPFEPDRRHIHHLLIDSGLSHMQATAVLVLVNACFMVLAFSLQSIGTLNLLLIILLIAIFLSALLFSFVNSKKKFNELL